MNFFKILIITAFISSFVQAQETPSVEKHQFKINVLLPGFVYEYGLSDTNTLYSELSSGYSFSSNGNGKNWSFYPYIHEQFRHYYNLKRRASKNKVTSYNSGGYVSGAAYYYFKSIETNDSFLPSKSAFVIAPVWGFQRTYNHRFNLDLNIGAGYFFSSNNSNFTPVLNFTLGWVIGK